MSDGEKEWQHLVSWQFGLVSRQQALAAGHNNVSIRRKLRRGEWRQHPFGAGVYIVCEWDDGFPQDCMAALLLAGPRALLSHRSAGRLLKLDGCEAPDIEVAIPRNEARPQGVRGFAVHQTRRIEAGDVCKRRGLRFTGLVRTVVDLTDVASRDVVVAGFEHAIRMSKRNRKRIAEKLAELEDGRRSTSVLHELIERRADHEPATENKLEAWCDDLLFKNGIRARRQFIVAHEGRFVARVDFALPELFYAIEFEGHGTHSSRSQKRKDALRKLGLNEVGWDVGVLTYEDVMSEGPAVQKLVRAVELRRKRFAKHIDARPLQQLPLFGTWKPRTERRPRTQRTQCRSRSGGAGSDTTGRAR